MIFNAKYKSITSLMHIKACIKRFLNSLQKVHNVFFNIIHTGAEHTSRRPRGEHEEIYNLVIIIYSEGSHSLFK